MSLLIVILAVFVILTFVVGVSFLFRGYSTLPNAEEIAPASELEKVQSDLKFANDETEKLRAQANTLAVQLEDMKGKLSWAQGNVKSLEEMISKGSQAQSRLEQLEKDLSFLAQKADSQAREAIDVITRLAAETEVLQNSMSQNSATASAVDVSSLTDENQKLKIQVDGYASKVKELEALVESAQQAGSKLDSISKAGAQLSEENTVLKNALSAFEQKIKDAQAEGEKLKVEQAQSLLDLQNKIAELDAENKTLRTQPAPAASGAPDEELKRIRLENEERIVAANAALVSLNSDMELLNMQISEKDVRIKRLSEELLSSRQEVTAALKEITELKDSPKVISPAPSLAEPVAFVNHGENENLHKRLEELLAANQHLRDKEKILTYKLAQSRAQAMSLEKICEDFKYQVEGR